MGNPFPLKQNAGKSFQGSIVLGKGFVLTPEEAQRLIAKDPRNKDVLFPYLNGDDLNNDPEQKPSRWVINFFDWTEEKARTYPDCFEIVERLVKPERLLYDETKNSWNKAVKTNWWQFGAWRKRLDEAISKLDQVMVVPLVSKYSSFDFVAPNIVYMHKLGVIVLDDFEKFGLLSSSIHNLWCWRNSSTLGAGTLNYSTTDCFETFPFPESSMIREKMKLHQIGEQYHENRSRLMQSMKLGLTKTYNLFHSKELNLMTTTDENLEDRMHIGKHNKESQFSIKQLLKAPEAPIFNKIVSQISKLRTLHAEMDNAVLRSYGWGDIELKHDFYEMEYLPENDRVRFSIHPDARKEILKRLLVLNRERYTAEQAKNLLAKKHSRKSEKAHIAPILFTDTKEI